MKYGRKNEKKSLTFFNFYRNINRTLILRGVAFTIIFFNVWLARVIIFWHQLQLPWKKLSWLQQLFYHQQLSLPWKRVSLHFFWGQQLFGGQLGLIRRQLVQQQQHERGEHGGRGERGGHVQLSLHLRLSCQRAWPWRFSLNRLRPFWFQLFQFRSFLQLQLYK